jgi:uncharacterized RDD family membrane protein YckC
MHPTSDPVYPASGYHPYAPPVSGGELGAPELGLDGSDHILAGRGTRLAAALIDGGLMLAAALPGGILAGTMAIADSDAGLAAGIALMVVCILALAIYQMVLISTHGQSLAKRWMGIKIIKLDGSPCGFVHGVVLRSWVMALIGQVPFVGAVVGLVDPLLIFGDERRCLHDLIAGTKVILAAD